jgi:peptidoglycan hydrolase-like protein with peptidoglycan-binding domain
MNMSIDCIGGSRGILPSSFPSDLGGVGGVESPPPMPDVGGVDDVGSPAGDFGFSGESGFDAGKVDPSSMLASQGAFQQRLTPNAVDATREPSALSALRGHSDFEPSSTRDSQRQLTGTDTASATQAARQTRDAEATTQTREPTSGASNDTPNLARGSRGEDVRRMQEQLRRAGFDPGPLDGKFGPLTEAALKRFQQARGLETDGIAGPLTKGALGTTRPDATTPNRPNGPGERPARPGAQTPGQPGTTTRPQAANGTPAPGGTGRTQEFLRQALSQNGTPYVFGAEANPNNPNPRALDCSELVEWAAARAGVRFPDGSAAQIAAARPMSVEQALRTPGALLYRPGHIAISLGDGRTIEARGRAHGTGIFNANGRGWTRAGTIPGM